MYVCVCLAVTEAEVEAAIAGGAHDRAAVTRACRAGGDCGACHGMIEQMIEEHLEGAAPSSADGPVVQGPGVRAQRAAQGEDAGLVPAAHLVRGRAA
jgi:bacterioferritin-associated ferredoxin